MTLHDVALQWVAEKIRGTITHGGIGIAREMYSVENLEPDVVSGRASIPSCHAWHEVEVLHLRRNKLQRYQKYRNRKILWIVLPKGTTDVFSIHLIEQQDHGRFKDLTTRRVIKQPRSEEEVK